MTRGDILLERPGQEEDTPLSRLSDMLGDYDPQFQEPLARVREAASLVLRVLAVWEVVRRLAVRLMEESLTMRAQQRELCPSAGVVGSGCRAKAASRERCIRCLR